MVRVRSSKYWIYSYHGKSKRSKTKCIKSETLILRFKTMLARVETLLARFKTMLARVETMLALLPW
jgi:hypothetical protein